MGCGIFTVNYEAANSGQKLVTLLGDFSTTNEQHQKFQSGHYGGASMKICYDKSFYLMTKVSLFFLPRISKNI